MIKKLPIGKSDIYLLLQNKTPAKQNVVLFDSVGTYNDSNALSGSNEYEWNIGPDLINSAFFNLQVVVLIATDENGVYQQYNYFNPSGAITNINQVVTGLNGFGIGTFFAVGNDIFKTFNLETTLSSISLTNLYAAIAGNPQTAYTQTGSLIYDQGYSTGMIGNLSRINIGNPFWINPGTTTDGPLNRSIISGTPPALMPVSTGLFRNINVSSTVDKVVYLGMSFLQQVWINNEKIVDVSNGTLLTNMANNINSIMGTSSTSSDVLFTFWHIIPITLKAGNNVIQVFAQPSPTQNQFGMEIYNNTAAEIAAATSYAGLDVVYSSSDYIGNFLF